MRRRALLTAVGIATVTGLAGCASHIREVFDDEPPVTGSCDTPIEGWPTAGGDPGRTGQTDTAPPTSDADSTELLAGVRSNGRQRLVSALPAVADGTAYVPSGSGIVALDLTAVTSTDEPIWEYDLDEDIDAVPTIACGAVIVPGLNRLTALDPTTGEQYWRVDVGGHHETTVTTLDETVYVAGVNPVAVDVRTGIRRWNAHGGDTLALDDSGVYTTLNVNGTGGIFAHDLDGEERWHLALGKIVGSASVHDGTVWVADTNGTVYAIDATTGETHWSRSIDGVHKIHSGLAVSSEEVVVPAGSGKQSVILDATTGKPHVTLDTGIVTGRPVIGDDWIAFGRTNKGITVYDRSTGEPRTTWSRDEHELGTVDGLVPIEDGFLVRGGITSGLTLIR